MSKLRTNIVEAFTAKEVSIKGVRCLDTRSRLNGIIKYKGNKFLFRQADEWVELGYGGMTLEDVLALIGPLEDSIAALELAITSGIGGPTSGELNTFHKYYVSATDITIAPVNPMASEGLAMMSMMGLPFSAMRFPEIFSEGFYSGTGAFPTSWDASFFRQCGSLMTTAALVEDMADHAATGMLAVASFDLPHSPGLVLSKFCIKYTLTCWPGADPTAAVPFRAAECLVYSEVGPEGIPEAPGFHTNGYVMPMFEVSPSSAPPLTATLDDLGDSIVRDSHSVIGSANPPSIPLGFMSGTTLDIDPATNGFLIPDSGHATPASRAALGTHIVEYTLATPLRLDINKAHITLLFATDPAPIDTTSGSDTDGDGICDEDCEVNFQHVFGVHGATLFLTSDLEVTLT